MGEKRKTLEYIGPKRGGVVVAGKGGAIYAFLPAKKAEAEGIKQRAPMQCDVPEALAEELLARKVGGQPVFRVVEDEAPKEKKQRRGDE